MRFLSRFFHIVFPSVLLCHLVSFFRDQDTLVRHDELAGMLACVAGISASSNWFTLREDCDG